MKRLLSLAMCLLLFLSLCSCERYFKINFNRFSFFDFLWADGDDAYSFELYQNPGLPLKLYGSAIYYYFMADYSPGTPPMLAILNPYKGDVRLLCADPECYHNSISYKRRCILCDVDDTTSITALGGYIYFAHADKAQYDEQTGKVIYLQNPFTDEVEYEYKLIRYHPNTGDYYECYTVEPGGYIDHITAGDKYVYFYETAYELIPNLKLSYRDGGVDEDGRPIGTYGFINTLTGQLEVFDAALFYEQDTSTGPLKGIRYARKLLLKGDEVYKKVYKLQQLNTKTDGVETLATRETLPREFQIYDSRIYELRDDGLYSYGTNIDSPAVRLLDAEAAQGASSLQYDEFTENIYYLKDGKIHRTKALGQSYRAERALNLGKGDVTWYQLSFDGIYFMLQGKPAEETALPEDGGARQAGPLWNNSVYFARYVDIFENPMPYEKVFEPAAEMFEEEEAGKISSPTVIGDWLYFLHTITKVYESYGETKKYSVTSGPYRYSLKTHKVEKIWPKDWELQS